MNEPPDEIEAELRAYRRELAQQLNANVDALTTNFDESARIASTVSQALPDARRVARDATQRMQYLEWWGFVTAGGRFKPRTWLGKRWFAWQYWLYAFRHRRRMKLPRR